MEMKSRARYQIQGKMKGRGRRWKMYGQANVVNAAFDFMDNHVNHFGTEEWDWRVWDTETDQEVKGRHYDFNDILSMRENEEPGAEVVLELKSYDDTAYHPGSTKHFFHGPLQVAYFIYPYGWNFVTEEL